MTKFCEHPKSKKRTAQPRLRRIVDFDPRQAKFTVDQAAALSGTSRSTIQRVCAAGMLKPQRILGRTVIDGDELRKWLANLPPAPVTVTGNAAN